MVVFALESVMSSSLLLMPFSLEGVGSCYMPQTLTSQLDFHVCSSQLHVGLRSVFECGLNVATKRCKLQWGLAFGAATWTVQSLRLGRILLHATLNVRPENWHRCPGLPL